METGFILFGAFSLSIILFALSFIYYGFKIYIKSYTFNSFVKLVLSYILFNSMWLLLFYSMSLAYGYPLSLDSVVEILEIVLVFFEFLLSFVILFYLLRIEERGFDYKYVKGIFISLAIYLISFTYYILSKSQISLYNSFDIPIYILLIPIFIVYTLKIIYNRVIKNKRIRYPILLLSLPVIILLTETIINGIYQSLHLIYNLLIALFGFSIFIFLLWLEKWLTSDPKTDSVNQSDNKYSILGTVSKKISDRFNRETPIKKSEYILNDEVRYAIKNNKCLDLENRDLRELKFMLVCANQEAENLKDELNAAHNWILTGFTLMLVPFILILNSFFGGLLNFQMDLITKIPHIESVLTRILSVFDISTQIFIYIIFIYILFFILMTFPLVNSPNSKVNSLIKKRKITSVLYEMSLLIFFVILVLKWLLSIKLDLTDSTFVINLLTGSVGLMFHTIGSLMISLNRKNITNANKIILDLNNRIIFYEEK